MKKRAAKATRFLVCLPTGTDQKALPVSVT